MPDILIQGPAGRLEARYHHSKREGAPAALILHPHPLHGGTMNNKVVFALYQTFMNRGFSVLRLNFRGVGKSQGTYDRGEGELADAAAGLDFLQTYNPAAGQVWISGFSFGAWIGMQLLMRRPETDGFIIVSPPANLYDFSFLAPCPTDGLVLQGDKDMVAPEPSVQKLAQKLINQKGIKVEYRVLPGANHFFQPGMEEMKGHLDDYLARRLTSLEAAAA